MKGILHDGRGRPRTGFQLHRSKWRFAWLLRNLAMRAKHSQKSSLGMVMVMMEKGNPIYFDNNGKLQFASNSRFDSWTVSDNYDASGDTKERGFIARDGHKRAYSQIFQECARIDRKLGNPPQMSWIDLAWANHSVHMFMLYYTMKPGSEMPWEDKLDLWNLGWGHPLSTLAWSDSDKERLLSQTGHSGQKMTQASIDKAMQGVVKI